MYVAHEDVESGVSERDAPACRPKGGGLIERHLMSRLSTDTSLTLVPLAETMMSLEAGLALELPEQSPLATNMNYPRSAPGRPELHC